MIQSQTTRTHHHQFHPCSIQPSVAAIVVYAELSPTELSRLRAASRLSLPATAIHNLRSRSAPSTISLLISSNTTQHNDTNGSYFHIVSYNAVCTLILRILSIRTPLLVPSLWLCPSTTSDQSSHSTHSMYGCQANTGDVTSHFPQHARRGGCHPMMMMMMTLTQ